MQTPACLEEVSGTYCVLSSPKVERQKLQYKLNYHHIAIFLVLRDIRERGRDLEQVLAQYTTLVKPAFEEFCLPVTNNCIFFKYANNILFDSQPSYYLHIKASKKTHQHPFTKSRMLSEAENLFHLFQFISDQEVCRRHHTTWSG